MNAIATFRAKAPKIAKWLMRDLGLKDYQACGILGNTGVECAGFTMLHEIGQPDGRGGYGWQQWTGPRRVLFLAWCRAKVMDWRSDDANYGYLLHELKGDYSHCIDALRRTKTLVEATDSFEERYERAGVPALTSRRHYAKIALIALRASP